MAKAGLPGEGGAATHIAPDFGAWREPQSCHVYPHKFETIPLFVLFKRTSAKRELENKHGMRQVRMYRDLSSRLENTGENGNALASLHSF